MELKIDIYYKNKKTNKFEIFHDTITEEELSEMIEERHKDNLPMWMDNNWEFENININSITT